MMAKISAHGATEVARWKHPDGRQFLLRSDGVLLWKSGVEGSGWVRDRLFRSPPNELEPAQTFYDKLLGRHGYERVR
jgi:hypothetical protein